ncbi:MAG: hypothetical protein OXJ62_14180 [Spirochaetaceae bacterium]|nr:hypothetical protein [Spirochaetaceae bacterium]
MPERLTRENARTADEVCEAVARWWWWEAHAAECPAERVPTLADLGSWLHWLPEPDRIAAVNLLSALLDGPAWWSLDPARPERPTVAAQVWAPLTIEIRGSGSADLSPAWRTLEEVHAAWLAVPEPRPDHPLTPLVAAWQKAAPPYLWDNRDNPVLPGTLAAMAGGLRPLVVANDPRQLPLALTGGAAEPQQLWLGFEQPERPEADHVPVLPLVAYDRRGRVSMTNGTGAAHAIRLYVEALLAVPPELRRAGYGEPANLHARLRDVVAGLWPRGWQRGRDWPRLLAGFDELRRLGVEWEHEGIGGVWFAVTVRSVPRDAELDDLVRFEVLLPPGSGPGPMVARDHLRLLGLDSAPAYRLYLSLCWYWDHYGTIRGRLIGADPSQRRGKPVPPVEVDGKQINPAALHRYPALTPDHLATMAYAPADLKDEGTSSRRRQRQLARAALDRIAKQTGAVVIPAPGRVAGTVQVLPPTSHKAAHDGKSDLWRNSGNT